MLRHTVSYESETQSARETPRLPSGSEGRAVGCGTATCCPPDGDIQFSILEKD